MKIENVIERCRDPKPQLRAVDQVKGIMIHRCGVDLGSGVVLGYDAPTISDAFTGRDRKWPSVSRATGGNNAYSIMIGGNLGPKELDGVIWQTLGLDEIGWHGRRFSRGYLGIAMIGDFREGIGKSPSNSQMDALVWVVTGLCAALRISIVNVVGHGEIRSAHGGEKAPGAPDACPGDLISMDDFRTFISNRAGLACSSYASEVLINAGLEI